LLGRPVSISFFFLEIACFQSVLQKGKLVVYHQKNETSIKYHQKMSAPKNTIES